MTFNVNVYVHVHVYILEASTRPSVLNYNPFAIVAALVHVCTRTSSSTAAQQHMYSSTAAHAYIYACTASAAARAYMHSIAVRPRQHT